MTVTFPYSKAPLRQIKEIQFGVLSPEEIVSRCEDGGASLTHLSESLLRRKD